MAVMEVGMEDRENSLMCRENIPSIPWEDSTASVEVGRTLPARQRRDFCLQLLGGSKEPGRKPNSR